MEGNECYKFSTIQNYLCQAGGPEIRTIVDIGGYAGTVSLMARSYFPQAKVYAFEADAEWLLVCRANTGHDPLIRVFHRTVTAQHLYQDDLGIRPYPRPVPLQLWRPNNSVDASVVVAQGDSATSATAYTSDYRPADAALRPITLTRLVRAIRRLERVDEIDILKMDCEGCEHSSLGSATVEDLSRIRFIVGEYHYLARFYRVMEAKLFLTHKVNLMGDQFLGCFFAERLEGTSDGILRWDKSGMSSIRPPLADFPLEWHAFNEQFIPSEERSWHGLP